MAGMNYKCLEVLLASAGALSWYTANPEVESKWECDSGIHCRTLNFITSLSKSQKPHMHINDGSVSPAK